MSNATRIALLLLFVALGAGGYWFYSQSTGGGIAPVTPNQPPPVVQHDPEVKPQPVAPVTTQEPAKKPDRVAAAPVGNTLDDAPQGVKGRILLPGGEPAAGVPVFLMENMMNDPFTVFLLNKSGKTVAPVSYGFTAENGTFALGTRKSDATFDLRVASDGYAEHDHSGVKVRDGDWVDVGDIKLETGGQITGRVVDETTKAGVPNATIYLADSNQAHTMLPTPGRERGIAATTDQSGAFRFDNAPATGVVNLVAEAVGYATTTLANQPLRAGSPLDVTLEIARGQPIAGIVVDANGAPLPNVQITAQGLSQKTPQTATTSSLANGTFQFECLREGPYQLTTLSAAYVDGKAPPVMTGDLDVKLVLVPKPWVKLKVLSPSGQPVMAYRIALKRHFPNNPIGIGNVPEFNDRSITPADYGGTEWASVRGLPIGSFVFQIQDRDHAKSLSEPFTVTEGGDPVEVTATLTDGATIVGIVLDDQGKPVRGANVSTDMNGALSGDGGPFLEFLRKMAPEKHSKAQTRTDGEGRFRLAKLAFADYMVRVSHDAFCEGTAIDIHLSEPGQTVDAGTIQLMRGCLLEGFTTTGGMAAGQVRVTLSEPPPAPVAGGGEAPKVAKMPFSVSTVSDNDGRYHMLKRVPPGTYKMQAMREGGNDNPFEKIFDIKETERTVTISAGQDRMQIDFNITAR